MILIIKFPIPSHLQNYLELVGYENDEFKITGLVKCRCGSVSFIREESLKVIKCLSCNKDKFEIEVAITFQGKDDFI